MLAYPPHKVLGRTDKVQYSEEKVQQLRFGI